MYRGTGSRCSTSTASSAAGTPGDVAVHRRDVHGDPDPVFFLGYWGNDAGDARQVHRRSVRRLVPHPATWRRWTTTATSGTRGRSDDMFKAAGYRIGPSEIENCLVKHPAVANAAVAQARRERGALVKTYVVLAARASPRATRLIEELQSTRARQARALRVPGRSIHRRAADDDHRQSAAAVLRLREEERAHEGQPTR